MGSRRTIQIDDDPAFQRTSWQVERGGWVALALLLTSAMLGAFGSGPFAHAGATEGALTVSYPRALRYQAPASLTLTVRHDGAPVRVTLARDWLAHVEVERTSPPADSTLLRDDSVVLVFTPDPTARGGEIRMDFRADKVGRLKGVIGIDGGPQIPVSSFVFP